jgi:hypothetical protein
LGARKAMNESRKLLASVEKDVKEISRQLKMYRDGQLPEAETVASIETLVEIMFANIIYSKAMEKYASRIEMIKTDMHYKAKQALGLEEEE